ncbi:MAG: DUF1499 domain-containing protein [Bdellovibrionales bacterium]|nr:DUF1499 domain-containing protein [Bdellovibrionales bacterium]
MNRALEGSGESYVRAKARSPLLGLWTDLEFHLDPAAKTVRYRVELRVPLLDLGATKSLATELRRALDGEL